MMIDAKGCALLILVPLVFVALVVLAVRGLLA